MLVGGSTVPAEWLLTAPRPRIHGSKLQELCPQGSYIQILGVGKIIDELLPLLVVGWR